MEPAVDDRAVIRTYYTRTAPHYRWVWSRDHLHFGWWSGMVRHHAEALDLLAQVVITLADLRPEHRALDAGCGVGGTMRLAVRQVPGATVDGITLVPAQAAAVLAAWEPGIGTVWVGDYHAVPVPPATYDRCWFIESFCHSRDPARLVSEVDRILRPGGRVVLADGFRGRPPSTLAEHARFRAWAATWAVPDLQPLDRVAALFAARGWVVYWADVSPWIASSAARLGRIAQAWRWCAVLPVGDPVRRRHVWSAGWAWELAQRGLIRYGLLVADKPAV
jgi:tocopherol O-methyltransferase